MKKDIQLWRDEHGIAHVEAATEPDVYWGQGLAHATDRGLYREVFRQNGLGEEVVDHLAEQTGIFVDFYHNLDRVCLRERSHWFGGRSREEIYRTVAAESLAVEPRTWGEAQRYMMRHLLFGGKIPAFLGFDRGPITAIGGRATKRQNESASLFEQLHLGRVGELQFRLDFETTRIIGPRPLHGESGQRPRRLAGQDREDAEPEHQDGCGQEPGEYAKDHRPNNSGENDARWARRDRGPIWSSCTLFYLYGPRPTLPPFFSARNRNAAPPAIRSGRGALPCAR
jgi:hypothetical protein